MKRIKRKNFQIIGIALILFASLFPYVIPRTLQVTTVTAANGSALDIQAAVDQINALGGGDVHIPEGTFNFVEVGEPWMTVIVPAGINFFGAPTERTSGQPEPTYGMSPNNQVVEWKTVLRMPNDVDDNGHSTRTWFFQVNGDGVQPFRFSDIELVGYRSIDPTSKNWHGGITMTNVPSFRIDHCLLEHMTGGATYIFGSSGIVDHSRLVNYYGAVEWDYLKCDFAYGLMLYGTDTWIPDIYDVIGQDTNQTVFIEDSYLSRWRHDFSGAKSTHIVFRHNTVEYDSRVGSLDAHGWRTYYLSTRAMEIYNNLLIDPIDNWQPKYDGMTPANGEFGYGVVWRGGSGVAFNNYFRGYHTAIQLSLEGPDVPEMYRIHDVWIWNNNYVTITSQLSIADVSINENVDYFLRAPSLAQDGFKYTPYPYPHPLVTEDEPPAKDGTLNVEASYDNQPIIAIVEVGSFSGQTPYSQELPVGTYTVTVTSDYGSNTTRVEILSDQTTSINIKWSSTSDTPTVDVETTGRLMYLLLIQIPMVFIGGIMIWKGREKQS